MWIGAFLDTLPPSPKSECVRFIQTSIRERWRPLQVVVKVLPPPIDGDGADSIGGGHWAEISRQWRGAMEILAALRHPNIAQVMF